MKIVLIILILIIVYLEILEIMLLIIGQQQMVQFLIVLFLAQPVTGIMVTVLEVLIYATRLYLVVVYQIYLKLVLKL